MVGDVMVDVSVAANALARGGDVHGDVRIHPGGAGANVAVAATRIGARVTLYGCVGDDLAGRLLREALRERGVDERLTTTREARTGAMLIVHGEGERSMVADRGANAHLSPDDLPDRLEADAVFVSGYLLFGPGGDGAARAALGGATARYVAVDAASWPLIQAYGAPRFFEATTGANFLFANELEVAALTGTKGGQALRKLRGRYSHVALKRGVAGATLVLGGGAPRSAGTSPIAQADPTGAGDAFDGTLLAALLAGAEPDEALRTACKAGASAAASPDPWPP